MPRIMIDGINLYYDKTGDGTIPLLLLPGLLGTVEDDFGPMIEKLDKELFSVVSWDPVGYGRSYPPAREVSIVAYPKDVVVLGLLMKELGFERYHVFGWSGGGNTGVVLAGNYPERVITLTTFAAPILADEKNLWLYEVMTQLKYWRQDRLQLKMQHLEPEYIEKLCIQVHAEHLASMKKGYVVPDEMLELVKCPTLILHGDKDTYADVSSAHHFHSVLPDSRLHIFPLAGHDHHLTNAEEVLKVWTGFVLKHRA